MRNITIPVVSILLLFGFYFLFSSQKTPQVGDSYPVITENTPTAAEIINRKAAFLIFTNNTKRVFSDPRYYNLSESVFLEAENPSVINVKSANVTWSDFFATLPMELTIDCLTTGTGQEFCNNETSSLKFYLNGERNDNALDMLIQDSDQLLVSYGVHEDTNLKDQLDSVPEP